MVLIVLLRRALINKQLNSHKLICCSNSCSIATGGFNCQFKKYFPAVTQRKDDVFKHKSGCLQMFLLYRKKFLIWIFCSSKNGLLPYYLFWLFWQNPSDSMIYAKRKQTEKKKDLKVKSSHFFFFSYRYSIKPAWKCTWAEASWQRTVCQLADSLRYV